MLISGAFALGVTSGWLAVLADRRRLRPAFMMLCLLVLLGWIPLVADTAVPPAALGALAGLAGHLAWLSWLKRTADRLEEARHG